MSIANKKNGSKLKSFPVLFVLILLLGIFARTWGFVTLPSGLNQDEAASGVDAYDLYHFGTDRNGVSFPVHLNSWGSGQNALYAYLLIPFIALWGLSSFTIRLPMLLTGILSLPLVYFIAKRTINKEFALVSMFFITISPWHIILSRWGLPENILPFVFLLGYACLLKSEINNYWFIPASLFFALSLYAYGTAYVVLPIFLAVALPVLLRSKRVSPGKLMISLVVLAVVALPIVLFFLINTFRLDSIQLGPVTIPRLPSNPRYEDVKTFFSDSPYMAPVWNMLFMLYILITQTDGLLQNTIEPYGYFYAITLPLAIIGIAMLIRQYRLNKKPEFVFLLTWLTASFILGVLYPININRINLIFIPLLLCMAIPIAWLGERMKIVQVTAIIALLIGFFFFTRDYHGDEYRSQIGGSFFTGILPALDSIHNKTDHPICITGTINMPDIYVLVSEKLNPADYLKNIEYIDPPEASFRRIRSLGRYTFGLENCRNDLDTIYILKEEKPGNPNISYKVTQFNDYKVYLP
jgi:hypothetical protein